MRSKVILLWKSIFYLFAAFPVFSLNGSSYILAVWSAISAFLLFNNSESSIHKGLKSWPLWGLYLCYLVALPFTDNTDMGVYFLGQKAALILIPFVFTNAAQYVSVGDVKRWLILFSGITVLYALIVVLLIAFTGLNHDGIHEASYLFRAAFGARTQIHPSYFALFLYSAALISLGLGMAKNRVQLVSRVVIFTLAVALGIMLSARGPLLSFLIILLGFLVHRVWRRPYGKMVIILVPLVFASMVSIIPDRWNRFSELSLDNLKPPKGDQHNGTNTRYGVLLCDVDLLKEHWLLGITPGEVQDSLNACYERYDTDFYKGRNYNTHSEYFNIWLSFGMVGFVFFLTGIFFITRYLFRKKYRVLLMIWLMFLLAMSMENYLDRQLGLFYFALIASTSIYGPVPSDIDESEGL